MGTNNWYGVDQVVVLYVGTSSQYGVDSVVLYMGTNNWYVAGMYMGINNWYVVDSSLKYIWTSSLFLIFIHMCNFSSITLCGQSCSIIMGLCTWYGVDLLVVSYGALTVVWC
jgi:hypothetical protein